MAIEEKRGARRGYQTAIVTCDVCGVETLEASVQRAQGNEQKHNGGRGLDEAGIMRRMTLAGWTIQRKKHVCPGCQRPGSAQAEQQQEAPVAMERTAMIVASPDRNMKRAIRALLDDVYDVEAGRYTGNETDLTVADAIGGGCSVEWVAAERKEGYGDESGNEAQGDLDKHLSHLRAQIDEELETLARDRADIMAEIKAAQNRASEVLGAALSNLNGLREQIDRARKDVASLGRRFPKGL